MASTMSPAFRKTVRGGGRRAPCTQAAAARAAVAAAVTHAQMHKRGRCSKRATKAAAALRCRWKWSSNTRVRPTACRATRACACRRPVPSGLSWLRRRPGSAPRPRGDGAGTAARRWAAGAELESTLLDEPRAILLGVAGSALPSGLELAICMMHQVRDTHLKRPPAVPQGRVPLQPRRPCVSACALRTQAACPRRENGPGLCSRATLRRLENKGFHSKIFRPVLRYVSCGRTACVNR